VLRPTRVARPFSFSGVSLLLSQGGHPASRSSCTFRKPSFRATLLGLNPEYLLFEVDFGMIKAVSLGCPLFDFDSIQHAKASFL